MTYFVSLDVKPQLNQSIMVKVHLYHHASFVLQSVKLLLSNDVLAVFKMADISHSEFDVHTSDYPERVYGGFWCCAKFGRNQLYSFKDTHISVICEFGLKMPIHAPFGVLGVKCGSENF